MSVEAVPGSSSHHPGSHIARYIRYWGRSSALRMNLMGCRGSCSRLWGRYHLQHEVSRRALGLRSHWWCQNSRKAVSGSEVVVTRG